MESLSPAGRNVTFRIESRGARTEADLLNLAGLRRHNIPSRECRTVSGCQMICPALTLYHRLPWALSSACLHGRQIEATNC